ncbi:hypothetical protein LWI29_034227 [Acer saccharum]|uniref:PSMD12/CSN4-like N-terminal domain-containing protein n=1 Tax=Acer saccharum TaxID=4024 RepID=A0AA39T0I3_ACESA|nr:hypothetical protein LWI29_034227 [Acer saccharum]
MEAQIDQLLNVQKLMRLAGEVANTKKAISDILQLCFEAKDWKTLDEQILNLFKKRRQLKQEEIHELLLSFAKARATVVRLKGGNPLHMINLWSQVEREEDVGGEMGAELAWVSPYRIRG